jgi:hypothetical protein
MTLANSFFRLAALAMGLSLVATTVTAAPFLSINFDSQNLGDPVATSFPGVPPYPITEAYATGGFPDTPPYSGTNTVASPAGLTKAALMSTTQGGIGANYLDTQFLITNPQISFDFDINVVDVPATGLPQPTASAPNGQAFAIQAFAFDSNRVWRFAVTPTSATTGQFAMRNNTDGDLIAFAAYTEGETYHLSIVSNYATNTVDVSLDGNPVLTNLPFVTVQPLNGGMAEFFFFQNGIEGLTNQVAVDNIVGVPEPSSLVLAGLTALGMVFVARHRRLRVGAR